MPEPTEQIQTVIRMLDGRHWSRPSKQFDVVLGWMKYCLKTYNLDGEGVNDNQARQLLVAACSAFDITKEELYGAMAGVATIVPTTPPTQQHHERELEAKIPKGGWLEHYIEYTRFTEIPLSFHIFSSLAILGCAVGRKVYFRKGHHSIYCNMRVLLIAPPGRCRKSTCVDIAQTLIVKADLCPVMADKITPEAISKAVQREGPHQFIGASELSVFLGKQRYMEGQIPLLLKTLDDRDIPFKIETSSGGVVELPPLSFSFLGGSTMSLLTGATSEQVASSGFLSRFVTVIEEDTSRCFPDALASDISHSNHLYKTLDRVRLMEGCWDRTPTGQEWYNNYYHTVWQKMKEIDDETTAQILERSPIHLQRIATLIHLADCGDLVVCDRCLETARVLMEYAERHVPMMSRTIGQTLRANDAEYVLAQIKRVGGCVDHSRLLRLVSNKGIDATSMKRCIETLKESERVKEEKRGPLRYYLLEER